MEMEKKEEDGEEKRNEKRKSRDCRRNEGRPAERGSGVAGDARLDWARRTMVWTLTGSGWKIWMPCLPGRNDSSIIRTRRQSSRNVFFLSFFRLDRPDCESAESESEKYHCLSLCLCLGYAGWASLSL